MSLINEALRKARREAAGDAEDAPRVGPPSSLRRASPVPWGVVAALGGVVLAAALGAGVTWWLLAGDDAPAEVPPDAVVADAITSPDPVEMPASSAGSEVEEKALTVDPTPSPSLRTEAPPQDASASPVSVPAPTATPRPAGPDAVGPDGELIYHVVAERGSGRLSLGYLIHRPVDPFAEINGQEVRVGSEVAGCTVRAIERTSVTLRCGSDTVMLRVD
jgi:hypothetical protein